MDGAWGCGFVEVASVGLWVCGGWLEHGDSWLWVCGFMEVVSVGLWVFFRQKERERERERERENRF